MGQAKRKAAEFVQWEESLSVEERLVARVSRTAYKRIVRDLGAVGMCYRMAFFLTAYLIAEHGIRVEPIVGYINDGTADVMASHAWIEFRGKKIDLSLTQTEYPNAQLVGPLIILDRQFSQGQTYTYHRERNEAAVRQLEMLMQEPAYRTVLQAKEAEHQRMVETAKDLKSIHEYLDGAPDGKGYEEFAGLIRSVMSGALEE